MSFGEIVAPSRAMIVAWGLVVAASAVHAKESTEKFPSQTKDVAIDFYEPDGTGTFPGVVVLHGLGGLTPEWKPQIEQFAKQLAATGLVVAVPHYLEVTGTTPGPNAAGEIPEKRRNWLTAANDATTFVAKRSNVKKDRMALVGFSMGGNLALDVAMMPPSGTTVRAVVDNFGPTRSVPLEGNVMKLPPTMIHHGLADQVVVPEESKILVGRLKGIGRVQGTDFEMHLYPGQGHGFVDKPSDKALTISTERSAQFLGKHLK